jgi:lysozyme
MPQIPQLLVSAQVATTARANLRQGNANTQAPILRKIDAGATLNVLAIVAGETVSGNPFWFQTDENAYIWAGACGQLSFAGGSQPIAPPPPPVPPPAPAPVPAQPAAPTPQVPIVVDIYHGDEVTDFAAAYAAGLRGVIHKATTGQTGFDKKYAERRKAATDAGLLWGAYHWGTDAPIDKQVDNFLARAKPDASTLVALDYEIDTTGHQMTLAGARQFLQLIEQKLGRKAVLYSGHLIKEKLGATVDPYFGGHRLWLAQYGPRAVVQSSWQTWWLWQYAEQKSTVPGIPGNTIGHLDFNRFGGDEAALRAQWAS